MESVAIFRNNFKKYNIFKVRMEKLKTNQIIQKENI